MILAQVDYISRGGKRIMMVDLSHLSDYGSVPGLADLAIQLAHSNQPESVLALIDLSGTKINEVVISSLKKMSANNGPYMKAIAFVGFGRFKSTAMSLLLLTTRRRNHKVIRDRESALRWLCEQE